MEVRGRHYATGETIVVRAAGGRITEVTKVAGSADVGLPFVGPGLVDLQVNGYRGRDFNRVPIGAGVVEEAVRLLWAEGTTSFYPTIITNGVDAIEEGMRGIARACEGDAVTRDGVAGIHLEGPFISPEDGARGAHAREFVRGPEWKLFQRWQEAAGGRIRIITMSPEWEGSCAFIERCAGAGVVVSIGHTAATSRQVGDAVRAGARLSTHLGNGAHLTLPRHPNYLWEQLAQDGLWACLIGDGFHVPDQVIKVTMRVKGARAVLVSDAVSLAGMPAGKYSMPVGGDVVLTAAGRLHLAADERLLAGSAQMLPWGVAHLARRGLATLGEAWEMASARPAELMGFNATLEVGAPADLILFRHAEGGAIRVERTVKGGDIVF